MSTSTRPDAPPPAQRDADSHDLIRVPGARENNLKESASSCPSAGRRCSPACPARARARWCSTPSPRNRTYSAFVQGWILFSRRGTPHVGSPNAFSFNVPSVKPSGEPSLTADYLAAYVSR